MSGRRRERMRRAAATWSCWRARSGCWARGSRRNRRRVRARFIFGWTRRSGAVLIIDDTGEPKPYTNESELIRLICWHFDHTVGKSVRGINLLSALYQTTWQGHQGQEVSVSVAFELIRKSDTVLDPKTGGEKRQAKATKNDLFRQMLGACARNDLPFRNVRSDAWFSSTENMDFIKQESKQAPKRDFLLPLKSNRKAASNPAQ